jgi:hypothetical protein
LLIWIIILNWQSNISANLSGVLQSYQQDLKEFGIGLKKETEVITGVTTHAVKDLPTSLETGATVAQVRVHRHVIFSHVLFDLWCHLLLDYILMPLSGSKSEGLRGINAYWCSRCVLEWIIMRYCGFSRSHWRLLVKHWRSSGARFGAGLT